MRTYQGDSVRILCGLLTSLEVPLWLQEQLRRQQSCLH